MINRCVAEVRTTHPDVKWSVEIAPDLPRLSIGDEDLEEVLLILLRNAIEAMRGSGAAGLAVFKEEDRVRLRVSDEGDGLSPAQNEKIFRAGYTTKEEGSGYGLFLARRILSEHAGTLEAVSGAAVGATFDAVLPTREGQEGGGA